MILFRCQRAFAAFVEHGLGDVSPSAFDIDGYRTARDVTDRVLGRAIA